jgi:ubiquinone/menaquinone biosynthesis C-methylase UbiE
LEYPPEQIPKLLKKIDGAAMVIGVRNFRGRLPERALLRGIASRIYGLVIKFLFRVNGLHDLQAGFKVFKREALERISPLACNGFEIDTEILVKAMRSGFKIDTVPVTYTYKGNSKVCLLSDSLKMFFSVLRWKANGNLAPKNEENHFGVLEEPLPQEKMYCSRNPLIKWIHNLRLRKALSLLGHNKGCLLDVGCGDGFFLRQVEALCAVGLDISPVRLRRAKRVVSNVELVLGDINHLPFKNESFDEVTCCDVLEHSLRPNFVVTELLRVAKRGGEIIVSTPNEKVWTFGRFLLFKRPLGKDVHRHDLSSLDIQNMFNSTPVCVQRIPFNSFPFPLWKAEKYRKGEFSTASDGQLLEMEVCS